MRIIRKQVLGSHSYYIPKARMVYLGNLSVNHASEEATHFLRHICAKSLEPRLLVDAFYARALEDAIAFLGSKVVNNRRKCLHLHDFERLARSRTARPAERELGRLVCLHARVERGEKVRGMAALYECNVDMFNALTHPLGYRLGDRIYYGLIQGQVMKDEVRSLFFDDFAEEGAALATYLFLVARTADVNVPERL
jgi:hypothetical protein